MTNREWVDLFQVQFNVSRTVAKEMLHMCMAVKKQDDIFKQFLGIKGAGTEGPKNAE